MTLAKHSITGLIADYPDNVIQHRVLGQYLEVVSEEPVEEEEEKVVIQKKAYRRSTVNDEPEIATEPATEDESTYE